MSDVLEDAVKRYRQRYINILHLLWLAAFAIICLTCAFIAQKKSDDEFIKEQESKITKLENDLRYYEDRVSDLEEITLEMKGIE